MSNNLHEVRGVVVGVLLGVLVEVTATNRRLLCANEQKILSPGGPQGSPPGPLGTSGKQARRDHRET